MDSLFDISTPRGMRLSEFTRIIGQAIRLEPRLQSAWVIAEMSDVRANGGHCYMELIEKNDSGATVAKMRATIWASQFALLRRKFLAATGQDIKSGLKVLVRGSANHHDIYGFSFNITDIDPSYTLGDMERIRREILAQLQREGIIDCNKQLPMPMCTQRIAVISAEGAAGYGDFMNQIANNPFGFAFYTHLFPAIMQGERTAPSVMEALERVEETIDLWDCVVIIRGGGATTDLNGFDNMELSRAVASFSLPVIVGIGHERDRTVLDEIAHTRAKTPTAAAVFLIDRMQQAADLTSRIADAIHKYSADRLAGEQRRLASLEAMVPTLVTARATAAHRKIESIAALVTSLSGRITADALRHLDVILENVRRANNWQLEKGNTRVRNLESLVSVLSPVNTLRRGYSITRVDGKAVKDASVLAKGTEIETETASGKIRSVTL